MKASRNRLVQKGMRGNNANQQMGGPAGGGIGGSDMGGSMYGKSTTTGSLHWKARCRPSQDETDDSSPADPGGLGARTPLAPRFFQNHAVFRQFLGKNPYFEQMLGSAPPSTLGSKLCRDPLTKILDPVRRFMQELKRDSPHNALCDFSIQLRCPLNTDVDAKSFVHLGKLINVSLSMRLGELVDETFLLLCHLFSFRCCWHILLGKTKCKAPLA